MKQRTQATLTCIFIFATALALSFAGTTKMPRADAKKKSEATLTKPSIPIPDPPGTVNGRESPELIPDRVGFMLLFRFISEVNGENEKRAVREFVRRQMGLGRQPEINCPPPSGSGATNIPSFGSEEEDIDALIAAAESFHRQVAHLDGQAKAIKDQSWPNPTPEVMARLTLLQKQKEALADRVIATLGTKLSPAGLNRVSHHVNRRIKHLTKKFKGPQTLPGGAGWRPHAPKQHH